MFLFIVLISGMLQSIKYSYLFWYGENLEGANQTIFGLVVLIDCASEVPMFFLSGWIIKKMGHNLVLTLGLIITAVSVV